MFTIMLIRSKVLGNDDNRLEQQMFFRNYESDYKLLYGITGKLYINI